MPWTHGAADGLGLRFVARRILRSGWHGIRRAVAFLGTGLLQLGGCRRLLNATDERLGPAFHDLVEIAFGQSRVTVPFEWRCRFGDRQFLMPVCPELQRSWNAALVWRWAGNRSIRKIYEEYLRHKPHGILVDVGANDGTHTYPFAAHGYRCVCFEPQSSCLDYIHGTCALNKFTNVTTVQRFVSDEGDAQAEFYVSQSSWFSSRFREHTERFESAQAVRVRTTSLDAFCLQHGISPTFLKIDVEGWEWHVLSGGREVLRASRPDVLVEVLTATPERVGIFESFIEMGYRCYRIVHYAARPLSPIVSREVFRSSASPYSDDYLFLANLELADALEGALT